MEFLFSKVAGCRPATVLQNVLLRKSMKWFTIPSYRHQLVFDLYFRQESCLTVKVNTWCPQKGHMGQGIQEWPKKNLWKTIFKKFEVIWSVFHKFYLVHSWIPWLTYTYTKLPAASYQKQYYWVDGKSKFCFKKYWSNYLMVLNFAIRKNLHFAGI